MQGMVPGQVYPQVFMVADGQKTSFSGESARVADAYDEDATTVWISSVHQLSATYDDIPDNALPGEGHA